MNVKSERVTDDAAFDAARRAILYRETPPSPPTEVALLRREVRDLHERLKLLADVLSGDHECHCSYSCDDA